VLVRQRCKLQQAGVQPLQIAFRHRVEVDAADALVGKTTLQPTKQDLGSAGIGDRALPQATLDLPVRRRLAVTPRCAAVRRTGDGNNRGSQESFSVDSSYRDVIAKRIRKGA
jgi:hypothetical protein